MPGARRLEVHAQRIYAVQLLSGARGPLAHGDDESQQPGVVLGNLRQDLDEVECPGLARLGRIAQSVEPGLKFIEQQGAGVSA